MLSPLSILVSCLLHIQGSQGKDYFSIYICTFSSQHYGYYSTVKCMYEKQYLGAEIRVHLVHRAFDHGMTDTCDNKPWASQVPCPLSGAFPVAWQGQSWCSGNTTRTCLCDGRAMTGTRMFGGVTRSECWVMCWRRDVFSRTASSAGLLVSHTGSRPDLLTSLARSPLEEKSLENHVST